MAYHVIVRDNFHYMDRDEEYESGVYDTWEEAVAKAKEIVDEYLESAYESGMAHEALYNSYTMFGEDPFIFPEPKNEPSFSAWKYARQRCMEICQK